MGDFTTFVFEALVIVSYLWDVGHTGGQTLTVGIRDCTKWVEGCLQGKLKNNTDTT